MAVNPEMLRLARQRKGFHQTDAAKRLGIEQPLLSRLENGLSDIRDEILTKAEAVYDVPRSFFEQHGPIYGAPVSVHPMWRKKADVSLRDLDGIVAELNIRVMHLRRLLEVVDLSNTSDIPSLDIDDYGSPEKVAALLRAHWRVPSGPIKNLTLLAEKAGLIVAHSRLGGAAISGVTFAAPGVPRLVVLNSDQPADRMRFTLAHEIGHICMHRFPSPTMEDEANRFASALLLPAADLRPYVVGRRVDLALLSSLKPLWRMSMASLLVAITDIANLSTNQSQYLWKQMSARGYRTSEPPELDFPREQPSVLNDLLRVARESLSQSIEEFAAFLAVNPHHIAELYPQTEEAAKRPRLTILK